MASRSNPPRASRPTSKPPTQVYQRNTQRGRGKAPQQDLGDEIEREIEEGLLAESENEQRAQPSQAKKKRKRVPPANRHPTNEQLYSHIKEHITWAPMRFPDPESLQKLGLYDDVQMVLQNIGLDSMLGMRYGVHEEESRQFLTTLVVVYHCEEHKVEGFGRIHFFVNDRNYKVGFKKLSTIFGFSDKKGSNLPPSSKIADDIWVEIARGARVPGEDKNSDITNPAIRYVHRTLSSTLFSRREAGGTVEDELKLLALGLFPLVEEGRLQRTDPEEFEDWGMVGFLMRRLTYYQDWAWTNVDQTPKLFIGSIITPILEAVNVDLGPPDHPPAAIDLPYLKKTQFLSGKSGDQYAYTFWSSDEPARLQSIFLPNESVTSLSNPQNIDFNPAPHHLVPLNFGPLEPILAQRKKKGKASSSQATRPSDADDEGPMSPVQEASMYGTERYYFQPYGGVTTNLALREALSQNAKLLRWNKMQDSTIHKLKKSVTTLKRQMKKVTSLLSQINIGSGCQRDDVMGGIGSSSLPRPSYYSTPRSPGFEQRRSRRNTSPPRRASSNESPSVATADDYDTEGHSSFA